MRRIEARIAAQLDEAARQPSIEIIGGFALPLQCHALAVLLNVPESESTVGEARGTHVFAGPDREEKGRELERHLHRRFDEAAADPRDDFFGILTRATFRGRPLTRDEMMGFGNLVFAGGRDTVINMVTAVFGCFAGNPSAMEAVRRDPRLVFTAAEELVRVASPVTHLGRTCPHGATVAGHAVNPGERVALTWASANFDDTVFACPHEVKLDRKPNPHVAYGFGPHTCIGSAHAHGHTRRHPRPRTARGVAGGPLRAREPRQRHRPRPPRPVRGAGGEDRVAPGAGRLQQHPLHAMSPRDVPALPTRSAHSRKLARGTCA